MARPGLSFRERLGAIERRVRRLAPVRGFMTINDTYNAAGGGLLASGLAFSALFAIIPALLMIVSLLVIAVDDPARRQEVIDWIVTQVPPLSEVANQVVTNLAEGARVGSVVGFLGFLWGASGFYLALDGALARFFPARRGRDPIMGRIRSFAAVGLLVGGVLGAFVTSTVLAGLGQVVKLPIDDLLPFLSPVVAIIASAGICLACYRLVPVDPPSVRCAGLPALIAGTFIGLLTSLFGLIGGFLVGGIVGLGAIASVFVALIWFSWLFQALLYGAAYARLRDSHAKASTGPPRI